ncbi:GNAT family N-acetyltransferase [Streptomyces bambusae]|nr:GNAT family N-acetyltransferase [Streptomyces bambusae]
MIDLEPGDPRLGTDVLPVLLELRPHLTEELFHEIHAEGHPQGLRFTAAFTDDGRCAGVAGWRIVVNTATRRMLYVDDLVTTEDTRSEGVGRQLLAYLEDRARSAGCQWIELDSGTQRTRAHRFYLRERMDITAFHFGKELD